MSQLSSAHISVGVFSAVHERSVWLWWETSMNNRISISVLKRKGDTSLCAKGEGFVHLRSKSWYSSFLPIRLLAILYYRGMHALCVCVCVCVRIMGCWMWRIEGRSESLELIMSAETISFRCFVANCKLAAHCSCWFWVYLVDSWVTVTGHVDMKPFRPTLHCVMQGQKLKFHVGCLFDRFYRNSVMRVITGFVSEVSIFVLPECVSRFISYSQCHVTTER